VEEDLTLLVSLMVMMVANLADSSCSARLVVIEKLAVRLQHRFQAIVASRNYTESYMTREEEELAQVQVA